MIARRTLPITAVVSAGIALALAACDREQVELLADGDASSGGECEICDASGCRPAPDGTACADGICSGGTCMPSSGSCGERFSSVASAERSTCAITVTGALYCWGENTAGQLGLGDVAPHAQPERIAMASDWDLLGVGWRHTCATRASGSSFCWGDNDKGEIGLGDQVTPQPDPAPVGGTPAWMQVTGGHEHTCARGTDTSLWCWGRNEQGETGTGLGDLRNAPVSLTLPPVSWRDVDAGDRHTCGVDWDGGLWCWGANDLGQLGLEGFDRNTPTPVGGEDDKGASEVSFIRVSAGGRHTCAIDSANRIWCWGRNSDGEAGRGVVDAGEYDPHLTATIQRFQSLSLGDRHSCAIAQDGGLYCWGRNDLGQLGLGDTAKRSSPTRVGSARDWLQVSAGHRHTCAVRATGALFCWGQNAHGELGLSAEAGSEPHDLPTEVCAAGGP